VNQEINIRKIWEQSQREKISPYKLLKRKIRYRKQNKKDVLENICCGSCRLLLYPQFENIERIQCAWIGVSSKQAADVKLNMACDMYRKSTAKGENENE
jgi:hypothetical protein